jgi:transmembrane protein 70
MASLLTRLRTGSKICSTLPHITTKQIPNCISAVQPHHEQSYLAQRANPMPENNGILLRLCHKLANTDHDKEIYSGILSTQIKLVKSFSLTTSFIGMACQPILYSYSSHANLAVMLASGAFLSFFTFVTPLLIHSVSKKYVTKLYYNQVEDKYTAVVYNIFIKPKKIEFRLKDVKVPDIPAMFTTFKAKNHPLFVDLDQFRDPSHYGKLLGLEKEVGGTSNYGEIKFENDDISSSHKSK